MSKPRFINVDFTKLEQKSYKSLNTFEKEIVDRMVVLSDETSQNKDALQKEFIEALMDCVSQLPTQQKKVLTWIYGLDGVVPLKEEAIAKKLDITQQAVSRLKKRAETQLKKKFREFYKNNF